MVDIDNRNLGALGGCRSTATPRHTIPRDAPYCPVFRAFAQPSELD